MDRKSIMSGQVTNRRNPSQARSKERVETLLVAVKELIEEQGTVNLKISDIAAKAKTSPSSIYQYFSDKESIIIALAEHYMAVIHKIIADNISRMQSIEDFRPILDDIFQQIFELHCKEAAMRQIWFESIDPKLNALALQDTYRNVDVIVDALEPFIHDEVREETERFILVASYQFGSIMRLCFSTDEAEALKLKDTFESMVMKSVPEFLY